MRRAILIAAALATAVLLSACATNPALRRGMQEELAGNWDMAVIQFSEALERQPRDVEIRLRLERAKRMASNAHMQLARELWDEERYEDSLLRYRTAVELDPLNRQAMFEFTQRIDELERLQAASRELEEWQQLRELEQAEIEAAAEQRPAIDVDTDQPQNFVFPNREIGEIYQALARLADINIVYHDTVRQRIRQRTDFIVNRATFWEAFDYFVTSNNHFYRMVNDNTLMIIDGSPNNRRQYEDRAVKVFFLSNAQVQEVYAALQRVLRLQFMQRDRERNAIIVRDTPQKLLLVSRLIQVLDRPKAEVVIDVEIIEVDRSLLNNLGVLLSNYSVTQLFINQNALIPEIPSMVRMDDLGAINRTNLYLTIPDVAYNFLKTSGRTRLLARPQVRITDGEKGELHIGERVPVRRTTFNPNQAAGIGIPVDAFEYESIGIRFEITPRVHLNNDISLEMEIDISSIAAGATTTTPTFTTRNIKSKIRLREGETNMLAGLIRQEEFLSTEGIAGLSDIPIIGRLFSSTQYDRRSTDIVITISPHVVRSAMITADDLRAIMVGPEINWGYMGTASMAELERMRFLRGVPLRGAAGGGYRAEYYEEEEDEYYYDEDEEDYYYEEEEEPEEPEEP